jgi:hypothetical protein
VLPNFFRHTTGGVNGCSGGRGMHSLLAQWPAAAARRDGSCGQRAWLSLGSRTMSSNSATQAVYSAPRITLSAFSCTAAQSPTRSRGFGDVAEAWNTKLDAETISSSTFAASALLPAWCFEVALWQAVAPRPAEPS